MKVGDLVYGMINPLLLGACSEYLLVSPEEIYSKPKSLSQEESAGLAHKVHQLNNSLLELKDELESVYEERNVAQKLIAKLRLDIDVKNGLLELFEKEMKNLRSSMAKIAF